MLETYGITEEEYAALLAAQDGACAICGGARNYNLDVDHDHAKERAGFPPRECIRGLLCKTCNRRLLPAAKDSVALLLSAVWYLEKRAVFTAAVLGDAERSSAITSPGDDGVHGMGE